MGSVFRHRVVVAFCAASAAAASAGRPAFGQFQSSRVALYNWMPLSSFPGANNGNDCWGYVSATGREYALMGVSNALVVVEITNPASPVIRGSVGHSNSLWGDMKVYRDYCYVSNESGGGIDVIDLSNVDAGVVTLAQRMTLQGVSSTHNVAIDEQSGFLYLCGANINGGALMAFNLSNPASPTFAGQWTTGRQYTHDAHVVTYTSGPFAGRQIAYCCCGGAGFYVVDVTNKANMTVLASRNYPNLSYCHQGWLSTDRQYFYLDDETDNVNETVIFDVSNPANPVLRGSYSATVPSTDHNLYYRDDDFIFEAEYHGGLRIFCASNPLSPVEVGWFDTYPENNAGGYDGAWSTYPYFPSGTVIVSDIDRGLFVLDVSEAVNSDTLSFGYPNGRPDYVNPLGGTVMRVEVQGACGASAMPGSGRLHYDLGAGYVSIPMTEVSPGVYDAVFPAVPCLTTVNYYVSAQTTQTTVVTDPPGAPGQSYSAFSTSGQALTFHDNFETDRGWTTEILGATSGFWERGVPVNDPAWAYDPESDSDGSGQCYLTQNALGNTDVDDGAVRLTSPRLDFTPPGVVVSYDYYLNLTNTTGGVDRLLVEINSNDGAGAWTQVALHTDNGGLSWRTHLITEADLIGLGVARTANMRMRFTANDANPQSIVESGLDAFKVFTFQCPSVTCTRGDVNDDGSIDGRDVGLFAETMITGGTPGTVAHCATDMNGNGVLEPVVDTNLFVTCLIGGTCP